jgi:HAMP domain-containing protein
MPLLGGIRPPIVLLSALLLSLAGVTALTLGPVKHDGIPDAVLTSQQRFAEDGAVALRASLEERVADLSRVAELSTAGEPAPADAVLDNIGRTYQRWRGTAVVEVESGRLLAARGELLSIPGADTSLTPADRERISEADGQALRIIRLENGQVRLLSFVPLPSADGPQRLLLASSSLRFPGIALGETRAGAVLDSAGKVLRVDGTPEPALARTDSERERAERSSNQLEAFAKAAVEKTEQQLLEARTPGSGDFPGVSGSLLGGESQGKRAAAGYARLAVSEAGESTAAASLGLTVLAMVDVAEEATPVVEPFFGLIAAGTLLVIGALAVALLLGLVQRPLLRLFLESRRLTHGELHRPVTVPGFGEAARIGESLERLRLQLLQESPGDNARAATGARASGGHSGPAPSRRGGIGVRTLMAASAALLLVWSVPLVLMFNRADTDAVPQQLVDDQRERTDTLSDRVRSAIDEGHTDLTSMASLIGDLRTPERMTTFLERTRREHPRYQSLYVLDADGGVLARAGDQPRHPAGEGPGSVPITMIDEDGKEPVLVGYAELPGSQGAAVVGEFRLEFINSLLKRSGLGEVRIVDTQGRTVGGSSGYQAFEKLAVRQLDSLVTGTNREAGTGPGPDGTVYRDSGNVQLAAAAPFTGGGAAENLAWTVVSWQPAVALDIPEYSLQNRTILAGLLVQVAVVACLGWLHIVVVRPLRELARQAEALADGDRKTVLYPRHHDEVGAVIRSLELLRQGLQEQRTRDSAVPAGSNQRK